MNTKITFHFILADNDVDGDDEAFTNGALEEICKLCIGHYGLFDGTEVKDKITNASTIDSCGATKDGKYYVYYDARGEVYTTGFKMTTVNNEVFFDTEENAQKCADWLSKHWREDGNGI